MKRPAFQFYPADWRKDPALSTCSMAARGLWIEVMCIAHEAEEYGVLAVNGRPMDAKTIARMVGETPSKVSAWLAELEAAAVFSRRPDGAIFSRRMVKDEHIRNVRAEAGRKGGNPKLLRDLDKQNDKQKPTPSSSSSSSCSSTDSPTLRTRDARAPAPDRTGTFEGHESPSLNPASPYAVALINRGFHITAMNPDLRAYVEAGGTVEHLAQVAAHPDCEGKSGVYVTRFARRELLDTAKAISPSARAGPGSATPKSIQALQNLEALKSHDPMAPDRNRDRPAEAAPALAGPDTGR